MWHLFESSDNYFHLLPNGDVYHNNILCGTYNFKNAIVMGREKRIPCVTNDTPLLYPIMVIDNIIPYTHLVVATEKEVLRYDCINRHLLDKSGNYYIIPRDKFEYAKIKGINS